MKAKYMLIDVESSKLFDYGLPSNHKNQAWVVQFAAMLLDENLRVLKEVSFLMKPPSSDSTISKSAQDIHGISLDQCKKEGVSHSKLMLFLRPLREGNIKLIAHNLRFDHNFMYKYGKDRTERLNISKANKEGLCTMLSSRDFVGIPPTKPMLKVGRTHCKNPKLEELYEKLFGEKFEGAHDALVDVRATYKCLVELVKRKIILL